MYGIVLDSTEDTVLLDRPVGKGYCWCAMYIPAIQKTGSCRLEDYGRRYTVIMRMYGCLGVSDYSFRKIIKRGTILTVTNLEHIYAACEINCDMVRDTLKKYEEKLVCGDCG